MGADKMIIENWKMSYEEHKGLACKAPCSMYSVLLENGIIEDPFYGLNELEVTKLSDKGCIFESEFIIDDEMYNKNYIELNFFGLDTICRIIVNDNLIDDVQNMHRKYAYDIKNIAVKGENKIRLEFSSPTEYFKKMKDGS